MIKLLLSTIVYTYIYIELFMASSMAPSPDRSQPPKSHEVEDPLLYASELTVANILPMVLQSVVDLGIFEIMDKATVGGGGTAGLSAEEIVAKLPATTNPEAATMLDRILRLLAGHKVVGCSQVNDGQGNRRRVYHLTAVSKYFVPNEDGVSLAPLMALEHDKIFLESWFHLKDAILEGGVPFKRAHGMHTFEYAAQNPRFNKVFNRAMFGYSTVIMNSILDQYKGFAQIQRLVDVGGGLGVTLKMITTLYPSIQGINFDLPHVIHHAPQYPGVEHIGGDMFVNVPNGDAICLKLILHNWSDDQCVKLLQNCYGAIPEDGKVIVIESILPFIPENEGVAEVDSRLDMIMLAQIPGGRVRSEEDFLSLATKAGFGGIRKECSVGSIWVVEFLK